MRKTPFFFHNDSNGRPTFAQKRHHFPDPEIADESGIVSTDREMNSEILLEAYSFGIFPWPTPHFPILWFSPDPRGVLEFKDLHISKSLKKAMAKTQYEITYNTCFSRIIENCAKVHRPNEEGSWISESMIKNYTKLHEEGLAHSVECWMKGKLVGGVYGVYIAGVFSGESMFYHRDNASKYCLVHLIEKLESEGHTWMDIQMVTDVLKNFGGKYIPRKSYLKMLEISKKS